MLGLLENVDRRIRQIDRWLPPMGTTTSGPLWTPLPGPQSLAYDSRADELFYGGAAGGGKSDLLLGLAITQHRKAIIFRREYPQLKDIILRSQELLAGTWARFNGQANTWRMIPGNRTLEFGAVQYEQDVSKYKGRAHDLKAFDEASDFSEFQYRFLTGWSRTTIPGQRVRILCAGNPPTHTEGEWVIRYWAPWLDSQHPHPARPGDLRWFAMIDKRDTEVPNGEPFEHKGETLHPKSRTFIPARLADNPHLSTTGYGTVLENLPEPLRSQLLFGDFRAGIQDDPWQVIPSEWIRAAQARWAPGDHGPQSAIGVDVARGGADQTVLSPRHGTWFAPLRKFPGANTPDGPYVAGLVIGARQGDPLVNVDVIGVGASVFDQLAPSGHVAGVNFAEGVPDATDRSGRLRFSNVRAHAYWSFREALDPTYGAGLALPPDGELLADLAVPKWSLRGGRIYIESKDEIKLRLGRSPDCGDAAVLAWYSPGLVDPAGELLGIDGKLYKSERRSIWRS
jgi:hypothetical protein